MNMEILMQYVMYMLAGIGVLAFFVSVVVQVVKEMPGLNKIQTNVVALAASIVITPIAVVILCMYFGIVITWQYVFASILAAFVVYLRRCGIVASIIRKISCRGRAIVLFLYRKGELLWLKYF